MSESDYTRRHFLQVPAAAVGSAVLLPAQSPNDTVRVAFIGVGNRGSFLLKEMLQVPGIKVVAICDINPEALKNAVDAASAAGHAPQGYAEFRKLLDRKDIDAVVIATPVDRHKEMAVAALEVGKHVYCEKPMALTPEECRMVANAAHAAKGIYQAGFQMRHDPYNAPSVKFIKEGGIGKVVYLQGHRHTGDLPRGTAWYFDRSRSGDSIVEQACHYIDQMVWVAGTHPLRAFGSGGINLFKDEPPGRTTMDNYSVIWEFPDNLRFSWSHMYFDPPGFSGVKMRVFGSKGAIDLETATWMEREGKGAKKLPPENLGKEPSWMRAGYLSLEAFIDNVPEPEDSTE